MPDKKKPPTYTPAPRLPRELTNRYELVLKALGGQLSVSEAARQAGLPRNHFQHLMHRAQTGLIEGLSPRPNGRPPKSAEMKTLEAENRRLREQTEAQEHRLQVQGQLIIRAAEVIQDQMSVARSRAPSSRKSKRKSTPRTSEPDDDGLRVAQLENVFELRRLGLDARYSAALVGVSAATVRRWRARHDSGCVLVQRRGRPRDPVRDDDLAHAVESLVRQSRGAFGADSLSTAVPGISRREAAAIKAATLTAMESERKRSLGHVVITEPGIVRGFDAMYVCTTEGTVYALCAGDGCVPYTTSIAVAERYDSAAVAAALDDDFRHHGPPLVLRMDRAACHRTDDVASVCCAHGVLVLHGPPRHPRFYGQLERQNLDRRVWLNHGPRPPPSAVASDLERHRVFLNSAWRRRSLGFLTAEERWKRRQIPRLDRSELREHVDELTARFAAESKPRAYDGLARRLAIELALTQRGYLRQSRREAC